MLRLGALAALAFVVLAWSALATPHAKAEQRAWECAPFEAGEYSDAHCITNGGLGGFRTVEIPSEVKTKFLGTNAKTASGTTAAAASFLRGHIAGVETEIQCTAVGGTGELTNSSKSVSGTGTLEYAGCTVSKPAAKGCKVSATITTKTLKATTVGQTGSNFKVQPNSGTEFAKVLIEGCEKERPPKGEYVVEGSILASTNGATATTTEAGITGQGTLLFGGTAAGLEGASTISKEGGSPITLSSTVLSGSRAFTCAPDPEVVSFADAHCHNSGIGYVHKVIPTSTETKITGTNAQTAAETTAASVWMLKGVIGERLAAVSCTTVSAAGELTNLASSVSGTVTISYSGCSVTEPPSKGCKVNGGKITTSPLRAGTAGQSAGRVKLEPVTGTEIAKMSIEGCEKNEPPAAEYSISGSFSVPTTGATLVASHSEITTQETLALAGQRAGLEGALTISKEGGSPIVLT